MPFSMKTIDFLFENRLQDSRQWFSDHKDRYEQTVVEPLKELVSALTPVMLEIDSELTTEPRIDKTISRIWRDTRYSRDKSLYRDSMWIIFKRGKMHGTEVPGLYFEITCSGFHYGCGFYHASAGYMSAMRELVLKNGEDFQKAQKAFLEQNIFHMEGETYRRPHYPQEPKEKQLWLEKRGICFVAGSGDMNLLFSKELAAKLEEDFRTLKPIYRFLLQASAREKQIHKTRPELIG